MNPVGKTLKFEGGYLQCVELSGSHEGDIVAVEVTFRGHFTREGFDAFTDSFKEAGKAEVVTPSLRQPVKMLQT